MSVLMRISKVAKKYKGVWRQTFEGFEAQIGDEEPQAADTLPGAIRTAIAQSKKAYAIGIIYTNGFFTVNAGS